MSLLPHQRELAKLLADWKAGKTLRGVVELGHTQKMVSWGPNEAQRIDDSARHVNRQELAYAWVFAILDGLLGMDHQGYVTFSDFVALRNELEETVLPKLADPPLSKEEREGAESLAWKAWLLGWKQAIAGHGEHKYIDVARPEVTAT